MQKSKEQKYIKVFIHLYIGLFLHILTTVAYQKLQISTCLLLANITTRYIKLGLFSLCVTPGFLNQDNVSEWSDMSTCRLPFQ
jgi:hypothetical protein